MNSVSVSTCPPKQEGKKSNTPAWVPSPLSFSTLSCLKAPQKILHFITQDFEMLDVWEATPMNHLWSDPAVNTKWNQSAAYTLVT